MLFAVLQSSAQLKPQILNRVGWCYDGAIVEGTALLDNGNTVMVGWKSNENPYMIGFIAWVRPDGSLLREHLLGRDATGGGCSLKVVLAEPGTNHVYAIGMAAMWDGKYKGVGDYDDTGFLIKYDAEGNERWMRKRQMSTDNEYDGLAFDAQGNVVVYAAQDGPSYFQAQAQLLTFNPDGQFIRSIPMPVPYRGIRAGLFAGVGDGTYWHLYFGCEDPADPKTPWEVLRNKKKEHEVLHLMKIDSDGRLLAEYRFPYQRSTMLEHLVPLANGDVLVGCRSYGDQADFPKHGAYVFRFNAYAQKQWVKSWHSIDGSDHPHTVAAEAPNGDLIVAMYTPDIVGEFKSAPRSRTNLYLTRLSAQGETKSYQSLLALNWYQAPEGIHLRDGKVILGIFGQTRDIAIKHLYKDAWYCTIDEF